MKIIIAPDSFKGSLTSTEAAHAIACGLRDADPYATLVEIPLADGGEGSVEAVAERLDAQIVTIDTVNPLMKKMTAKYAIAETAEGKTTIIETAAASGLNTVSRDERDIMASSTFGTGLIIADAFSRGCRNFIVGLGGSATNDAGLGILAALGYRLLDRNGKTLTPSGASLSELARIVASRDDDALRDCRFTLMCDVDNPLYGKSGAAFTFAAQKGASPQQIEQLDLGLRNWSRCVTRDLGIDVAELPGAGAAGGLGAMFAAFFNAEMRSGIEMVLDLAGFDDELRDADLVITGEGRMDSQTLHGKVPMGVLRHARRAAVPVIALSGAIDHCEEFDRAGMSGVFSIQPSPVSLDEAMQRETASRNLRSTASQIMQLIKAFTCK